MQILIALAFLSIPLVRSRYGSRTQAAVETGLGRQGYAPRHGRERDAPLRRGPQDLGARRGGTAHAVPAVLGHAGNSAADTLTWIDPPW
ncbi:hypothetical protein ACFYNW_37380 [Streptomyces virginiae]|uniref:hypothetical protein n=1 Tax=Streptomyces virginiae TaxID=1961 RepID=UPI0036EEBA70